MRIIFSLLFLLTTLFFAQPASASEPAHQPTSQPITAPLVTLTYDSPTVTTSPAPQVSPIPSGAPEVGAECEEDMACWEGSPSDDRVTQPTTCTEDMPCWNCATMGNHQCGSTLEDDALASYETSTGQFAHPDNSDLSLKYFSTTFHAPTHAEYTATQFVVQSVNMPNTWHIMGYVPLYHC